MPLDRPRATSAARDESLAWAMADRHGLRPDAITRVEGHGSVNHVFVASSGTERFVIRFAKDARRKDEYQIEAWCLAQAAAHGIPSPAVVARGTASGVPYLIQTFVAGASGAASGGAASWQWLARYARALHTIDVTGAPEGLFSRFGRDLPAGWLAHLEYNVEQLTPTR
ncbi:MAG: phosphotransferase [Nocardioidaceae bacterium]